MTRGLLSGALRGLFVLCLAAASALAAAATPVRVLQVHDAIGPASADYILRGIAQASAAGAPLVVIELDTPGGLDTSMRQIIKAILASPVPVAVFVAPRARAPPAPAPTSSMPAHVAAMAPATNLGAATPVAIGLPGAERKPPAGDQPRARPKARAASAAASATAADTLADADDRQAGARCLGLHPRPGAAARPQCRMGRAGGARGGQPDGAARRWRAKVIDLVADDVTDLLTQIDGRRVRLHGGDADAGHARPATETVLPDWRQRLLSVIANPSFALILMMIGIYGLLFEFSSPGFGVPGMVGAICLLLALFALQLLPVNYAGLGLILLGIALLVAELLVPELRRARHRRHRRLRRRRRCCCSTATCPASAFRWR